MREGSRTRILRGGPGDDIGSLIGQIPEKNALLRLLSPSSLYLAFALPFSLAGSIFLFLDRCRLRCPCQFREGGAR